MMGAAVMLGIVLYAVCVSPIEPAPSRGVAVFAVLLFAGFGYAVESVCRWVVA